MPNPDAAILSTRSDETTRFNSFPCPAVEESSFMHLTIFLSNTLEFVPIQRLEGLRIKQEDSLKNPRSTEVAAILVNCFVGSS